MAEDRADDEIYWVDPVLRGIVPLDGFHMSRSLAKTIRSMPYTVTRDHAFDKVVSACAERQQTWINRPIQRLYGQLHGLGFAHSIEVWEDENLVGGLYGVTLGAAFFGESMFSRRRDTSKIALAYTVAMLRAGGYRLFDTQFLTDHLASLGAVEIERDLYHARLRSALDGMGTIGPAVPGRAEVIAQLRSSPDLA